MNYHEYLNSPEWKMISSDVKARAKHRCQICNSSKRLETHHRSYQHLFNERDHMEDLVCLCDECHERHHFPGQEKVRVVEKVIQKTVVVERVVRERATTKRQRREERKLRIKCSELSIRSGKTIQEIEAMTERQRVELKQKLQGLSKRERRAFKMENRKANDFFPPVIVRYADIEAEMPDGDPITLTRVLLNRLRTNGAFTGVVMRTLGVTSKPEHGWVDRLIGTTISRHKYAYALGGRKAYANQRYEFIKPDKNGLDNVYVEHQSP